LSRLKRLTKKATGEPVRVLDFKKDTSGARWTSIADAEFTVTGPLSRAEMMVDNKNYSGGTFSQDIINTIVSWAMQNITSNPQYAEDYMSCIDLDEELITPGMTLEQFEELSPIEQIKNIPHLNEMIEQLVTEYPEHVVLVDSNGKELE